MGVKLICVCSIRDSTGLAIRQKYEHLHARQKAFNETLESWPVYALQDAYTFDTRFQETLADGIMVMIHTKMHQLVHSLDQQLGPVSTSRVSYTISHGEEAAAVIDSIVVYLAHQ
jgi:hypothetical protein